MGVGASGTTFPLSFDADVLTSGHVGQVMAWKGRRFRITAVANARRGTGLWLDSTLDLQDENGDGVDDWDGGTPRWTHEVWSDAYGYPSCGAFMDGRLWLAASRSLPSTFWASRPGAWFNWDVGKGEDGDAIVDAVMGEEKVVTILHLLSAERLLFFTDGGVFYVPGTETKPATAKSLVVRQASEVGVSRCRPAMLDGAVVFVDAAGRTVLEGAYDVGTNTVRATAISLMAEHLIDQPRRMAAVRGATEHAERLAVLCNPNGSMSVLHRVRAENITAWVPWFTDGVVKDVAAVLGDIYVLVERDDTERLEVLTDDTLPPLDGMKLFDSPGLTRTITGMDHLAGLTVGVWSRGHDLCTAVVGEDGVVHLPEEVPAVFDAAVGLRFSQRITLMPAAMDLQDGSARHVMKRLLSAQVEVRGSGLLRINGGDHMLAPFVGDDVLHLPPEFDGTLSVRLAGISREAPVTVVVPGAHRITVLAITRAMQVEGRD